MTSARDQRQRRLARRWRPALSLKQRDQRDILRWSLCISGAGHDQTRDHRTAPGYGAGPNMALVRSGAIQRHTAPYSASARPAPETIKRRPILVSIRLNGADPFGAERISAGARTLNRNQRWRPNFTNAALFRIRSDPTGLTNIEQSMTRTSARDQDRAPETRIGARSSYVKLNGLLAYGFNRNPPGQARKSQKSRGRGLLPQVRCTPEFFGNCGFHFNLVYRYSDQSRALSSRRLFRDHDP
jgi:hypothetical protein